ncbi:MAG TPA: PilZ domain-containing protein [Gammaproteobacteria bacterium]|nr:PilZ domain-containing protein [Gammaproteobacteria bacterium]
MEQRTWKRDSLALDVEIRMWRPAGEEILCCKTLDVSLGGAELLTHNVTFPKHRVLEIRFSELNGRGLKQSRILGKFIRKTNGGIAIQFRKANNDTLKILQALMVKDRINKKKIEKLKYGLAG